MKPVDDLDEQIKNEESTKLKYITPALQKKWNADGDHIVMEYGKKGHGHYFTDGQILVEPDGSVKRGEQKKIDYLLLFKNNLPLLFFDKVGKTKEIWYYRMDMPEGRKHFNKTHPITREDMAVIDEWWENRREIKDEKNDPSMTETWKAKKYSYKEIEELGFDLNHCGFPEEEEIILSPEETISVYKEKRETLEVMLDEKLNEIINLINV